MKYEFEYIPYYLLTGAFFSRFYSLSNASRNTATFVEVLLHSYRCVEMIFGVRFLMKRSIILRVLSLVIAYSSLFLTYLRAAVEYS